MQYKYWIGNQQVTSYNIEFSSYLLYNPNIYYSS